MFQVSHCCTSRAYLISAPTYVGLFSDYWLFEGLVCGSYQHTSALLCCRMHVLGATSWISIIMVVSLSQLSCSDQQQSKEHEGCMIAAHSGIAPGYSVTLILPFHEEQHDLHNNFVVALASSPCHHELLAIATGSGSETH
jgi:hypothetical protein